MKLSMLPIVERTAAAHRGLCRDIKAIESGQFVITVDGNRQDEAMLAVARPVILNELKGRKASLERDLESYGVTIG